MGQKQNFKSKNNCYPPNFFDYRFFLTNFIRGFFPYTGEFSVDQILYEYDMNSLKMRVRPKVPNSPVHAQ